jgi:ABC-2 type transport system ATP-binding protein
VLREVESVADRVAIIRAGRIVDVDSVRGLRERAGQRVALTFAAPPELAAFADVAELHDARLDGATVSGLLRGAPDALLKAAARFEVVAWSARDRDLEDLFLDVYRLGAGGADTNGGRDAR